MFPINCLSCCSFIGFDKACKYLCLYCQKQVVYRAYQYSDGVSLFEYHSTLRNLVLGVKINSNPLCLYALKKIFLESEALPKLMQEDFVAIAPASSSLASRMKGSFDLSWHLARFLSIKYKIPLISPSRKYSWQFKKRSKLLGREIPLLNFPSSSSSKKVLLIDDVLTSGFTLNKLAHFLQAYSCQFMALADAWVTRH